MMPVRIQRKRSSGWTAPEGAVYVGRPTRYGNPFHLGKTVNYGEPFNGIYVRDREHAVELFRELMRLSPVRCEEIRAELGGKTLMCWCPAGSSCHGDVLLRIAAGGEP